MEHTNENKVKLKSIKLVKMGHKHVLIVPAAIVKHELLKAGERYDLEFTPVDTTAEKKSAENF